MGFQPKYTKEQIRIHRKFRKKGFHLRTAQIDEIIEQRKRKNSIIKAIGLAIALASFLFAQTAKSDQETLKNDEAFISPVAKEVAERPSLPIVLDKPTKKRQILPNSALQERGRAIAGAHDVSFEQMDRIITCESGWNPNAKNPHSSAMGLVQILLSAHLDITEEQALDPIFSLEYLASNLESGHASMWVCK